MFENITKSKKYSKEIIQKINALIPNVFNHNNFKPNFIDNICVYACGSLGRGEITQNSDLDLFFINSSKISISNTEHFLFFSKLYGVNEKLGFKPPSKNGAFWYFHSLDDLLDIGSQKEDYTNSFTSRLLLILESIPIININFYDEIVKKTIEAYFVEYEKYKEEFLPMYLINDILRYWYTLTQNYEFRRDNNDSPQKRYWKRLKLKFPRLLTCFATIGCLFENNITPDYVINLTKMTPLQRLDNIAKKSNTLDSIVNEIKSKYDWFLGLTNYDSSWWNEHNNKKDAFDKADHFHDLVVHKMIKEVSKTNLKLKMKLDF